MQNLNTSDLERDIQKFKLPGPLLVSRIEEQLPFGMMRRIPVVRTVIRDDFDAASLIMGMRNPMAVQKPNQFNKASQVKSPSRLSQSPSMPVPMNPIQVNSSSQLKPITFTQYKQKAEVKILPSPIINSHAPNASTLYFDQTLLLFTRSETGNMNPTLISSNFNGSVSGDRMHFGAILRSGCWLLPTGPALAHPRLPPTANNKLKLIKCAEFMEREWPTGMEVERLGGLAIVRPERAPLSTQPNLMSVVGRVGAGCSNAKTASLYWVVLNSRGRRCISWIDQPKLPFSFTTQEGDWLVLMRSVRDPPDDFIIGLKRLLVGSDVLDDLEARMMEILPNDLTALVVSKVTFPNRVDQMLMQVSFMKRLSHVNHLDSRRGVLTDAVEPGRFGSTTRHCVIYRPHFLAALHHDASKINRFAPTIDYIIKKILAHPQGQLDLRRISEIQYYAYVISHADSLYCTVGGGASIVIIPVGEKERIVIEEAGVIKKFPTPPGKARIFLLSPHFYTLRAATDPKAGFYQYCRERMIDLQHPKLSFAEFQIE